MNEFKIFEFYNKEDEVIFVCCKRSKEKAIAHFKEFYPYKEFAYIYEKE